MKELNQNSKKWLADTLHYAGFVTWSGVGIVVSISLLMTACQSSVSQPAGQAQATAVSDVPTYAADIAPLLKQKCSACHGFLIAEKGLRLNSLERIFKGGESGPAVVPGAPQSSPLYTALSLPSTDVRHMPPLAAGPDLTNAQKKLIHDWIAAGAD